MGTKGMSNYEIEMKLQQIISWMNSPVRSEQNKQVLSDQYFDLQTVLQQRTVTHGLEVRA